MMIWNLPCKSLLFVVVLAGMLMSGDGRLDQGMPYLSSHNNRPATNELRSRCPEKTPGLTFVTTFALAGNSACSSFHGIQRMLTAPTPASRNSCKNNARGLPLVPATRRVAFYERAGAASLGMVVDKSRFVGAIAQLSGRLTGSIACRPLHSLCDVRH